MSAAAPRSRAARIARSEVWWGIALIVTVVGLLAASGVIQAIGPGQRLITAQFAEAEVVSVRDRVRVAGVDVGKVTALKLRGDRVDATLSVDSGVKLGSETSAQVKLLTLAGGYFIDLAPAGSGNLPGNTIAVANTALPYTLVGTVAAAAPKSGQLDGDVFRDLMAQLSSGLAANPGAIKKDLRIVESMLTNLQRHQDDFGGLLKVVADYSREINRNGDVMTAAVRRLSVFLTAYTQYYHQFDYFLETLAQILERAAGVSTIYLRDIEPLTRRLDAIGHEFRPLFEKYKPMIESAGRIIRRLENSVRPDGTVVIDHSKVVLSTDYCIPSEGVRC
jgi:phospholipid/cholesterol/gamma-HCH transport system substrate-binding protein